MADTDLTTLDLATSLKMGGTEVLNTNVSSLPKVAKVALGSATANGGLLAWANPESGAVIVIGLTVDVTTSATAACTGDFGVATSGTGTADDLIDALDLASAAIVGNSEKNAGTNGLGKVKVPVGQYVTGSSSSTASDSLVGSVYIEYVPA